MNTKHFIAALSCLLTFSCKSQDINIKKDPLFVVGKISLKKPVLYSQTDSTGNKSLSFIVERDKLDSDIKENAANKLIYISSCRFYKKVDGLLFNKVKIIGLQNNILKAMKSYCNDGNELSFLDKPEMISKVKYSNINCKHYLLCFVSAQYFLTFLSIDENVEAVPKIGYIKIIVPY